MARKADQIASLFASVGFKIDRAGLKEVDVALGRVEKRLAGIVKAFQGMSGSKSLTGALRATAKDSGKAAAGIDEITARLKAGIPALSTYTQQMRVLAAELRSVTGARPNLPRVPAGGGGRGATGGGSGASTGRGGFFAGMAGGLFGTSGAGLIRGMLPGIGAGWAIAHGTTRAREMIANEAALGALTGSQAAGRQEYNYIQDFSNKYGIRANESVGGYKRILASSVGTKLQGQGAKDIFEGVSLYGKALGLSDENMSRATTAISQMISKGKISSEELKGQLAEATPGAVQLFAKAITGGDVAKLFDMMEKGQVLAADVMPRVAEAFREAAQAGGALNKMMKTSASEQARFMNAWDNFLKVLFESGLDEGIAGLFKSLTILLTTIAPVIEKVAGLFGVLVGWISALADSFAYLWENPALLGVLGVLTAIAAVTFAGPIMSLLLLGTTFAAVMASVVGWASWAGRMIFLRLLPLFLILDTIEALATGKTGMVGLASKNTGLHDATVQLFEDVLGGTKQQPVAVTAAQYGEQLSTLKSKGDMGTAAGLVGDPIGKTNKAWDAQASVTNNITNNFPNVKNQEDVEKALTNVLQKTAVNAPDRPRR